MNSVTKSARKEVDAVLTGYCSTHPEVPALYDGALWQAKAQALLEAREFDILQALSPETIREIAEGRIDMADVYRNARQNQRV